MLTIGIDPGLNGAIALRRADGTLDIKDVPTLTLTRNGRAKREVDPVALARIIRDMAAFGPCEAYVEQVNAMPGQGVTSMFNFGLTYGLLRGVLAALSVPTTLITPAVWKKAMRVSASKDGARARASELFPQHSSFWTRVKDDGRAEAAMIALWGFNQSQLRRG